MTSPESELRIAIETKIAFLERTVDDLNEVLLAQGRDLEAIEARLARLEGRLRDERPPQEPRDLADDRPPHY